MRGKDFSVFELEGIEFALARKETKRDLGHNGFEIIADKSLTIEDDLIRRDLTINSMAVDVITNQLIDPFKGLDDCKNKIIRATSTAFSEDPLRVYRAARFSAEYKFNIDPNTKKLMSDLRNELSTLSSERVFVEFRKALISKNPSRFFEVLKETNCLDVHFKEIHNLIGIDQPLKYHPEGDVFNHTMQVIDRVSAQTDDEIIRFAALVHDFGKIATPKDILPHHYNHEKNGDRFVNEFTDRLKMPTKYKKAGIISCHEHMKAGKYYDLRISTKVDFLVKNSKNVLGLKGLEIIANCDKERDKRIEFAKIGLEMIKEINGKNLDVSGLDYIKLNEKIRQKRISWLKNK